VLDSFSISRLLGSAVHSESSNIRTGHSFPPYTSQRSRLSLLLQTSCHTVRSVSSDIRKRGSLCVIKPLGTQFLPNFQTSRFTGHSCSPHFGAPSSVLTPKRSQPSAHSQASYVRTNGSLWLLRLQHCRLVPHQQTSRGTAHSRLPDFYRSRFIPLPQISRYPVHSFFTDFTPLGSFLEHRLPAAQFVLSRQISRLTAHSGFSDLHRGDSFWATKVRVTRFTHG
jgi:hypothetical protein